MKRRRMNQVPLFSSAGELANMLVTSNLIEAAWAKIPELQRGQSALPSSVQTMVDHPTPKCTIVVFAPSPDSTQDALSQGGDLVPYPKFDFLCTKGCPSVSINRAALTLFTPLYDHLSGLKDELNKREGQLIITGQSLGGSIASLFTLFLLSSMDKESKCRPICITFGSPLIGNFGLQHSHWNSFFLHLVSDKDPLPTLFLPSGRSAPTSSHSQATAYKPFGTYLLCSELGCACFDDPDFIFKFLTVASSEVAGGLQVVVDYGEILRNLKYRAICKGPRLVGERLTDPFSAGIVMELKTIGIDPAKHNIDIGRMEKDARDLTWKTNKASEAKKLNDRKINMVWLEWYRKKAEDVKKDYYDCFRNERFNIEAKIQWHMEDLTTYWEDMVAEAERKPQKEGASFRTGWLQAGTTYRRMVEPLDIAVFYKDGGRDYINSERSQHYKLLEQWYEEAAKPPTSEELDSKKQKVSVLLTEDSCFWAHVEEAILSCKSLTNANSTPELRESSWNNLVKFGEYVMEQIENYAVSPEIFLKDSCFMTWWGEYKVYIASPSNPCSLRFIQFIDFMKTGRYGVYGRSEVP